MRHVFIIRSSPEGHLGCFRFLSTVNRGVKKVTVQGSEW